MAATDKSAETRARLTVVEAMAAVMGDVQGVGKDGFHDAPGAKFKFRGIDAVMNAVGPALRTHRVVVVPQLVSIDHRDVTTSGGKPARETCVLVKYLWTGPDGSTLETVVPGEAMDNGDKGTAKAMSVAFRIALLQALCLPTDDPEPDAAHYEREAPRREEPAPPTPAELVSAARSVLAATCAENGWDRDIVAAMYEETAKHPLHTATDAARIGKFRDYLFSLPQTDLQPAAAAVNGGPA